MSDTNPLPASEFRRLCDEVIYAVELHALQVPEKIAAYRAARAASPVTLEEALMTEYGRAYAGYFEQGSTAELFGPERDAWGAAATALGTHARRLAGEGGAA